MNLEIENICKALLQRKISTTKKSARFSSDHPDLTEPTNYKHLNSIAMHMHKHQYNLKILKKTNHAD